nr:hypothetical protein [Tanacetum cinerariifolium]
MMITNSSCNLDLVFMKVESDGLGLGQEEEAVPEGQQQAAPIMGTFVRTPLGLGLEGWYGYIDGPTHPPPTLPTQTPPLPEWSSGPFPISPALSIVPSPISSPMISQTVPSPIASPVATSITTILVDKDQFLETDLHRELHEMRGCVTAREGSLVPSGGYHSVPPPVTGTFTPPKTYLVFHTPPSDENEHLAFNVHISPTKTVAEDVANEAIPFTPTPLILPSPPSHDIPSTS